MKFCGNCGSPLPELGPEDSTAGELRVLSGTDLSVRLDQAGIEASGERRNVTVLFADLSGYTAMAHEMDSEDTYLLIQRYLRSLAEDVFKYEGTVDKFTGDGLMALFGAPVAHENDSERAIRAALDMQASVAQISQDFQSRGGSAVEARIGLHTGEVIVGQLGHQHMVDYTAIGDTVNLASRLESVAQPGSVLVSDAVYRQTRALFDFERIDQLEMKGVDREVTAYQVIARKHQPGRVRGVEGLHAEMVGREWEISLLNDRLRDLMQKKRGQFALITGEAGIGKSRLTQEFTLPLQKNAEDSQYPQVLFGRSLTYRKSISYWIFVDILRAYFGVNAESSPALIRERITQQLKTLFAGNVEHIRPYLEHVLDLEPSDEAAAERLGFLDPKQLRQQIFLAIRDLLIAQAKTRPLMMVFDDLHWADETSLELLAFLLESIANTPIFIFGISRSLEGGAVAGLAETARQRLPDRFLRIEVRSLSRTQCGLLLDGLLSESALPDALRVQLIEKAAGVPLFLEEILRMLIEGGVIEQSGSAWRLLPAADISDIGVPDNLQSLILARFDKLDRIRRRVLQVAAVIGREFSLAVLEASVESGIPAVQVESALKSLLSRNFILPRNAASQEYAFTHVLTSDAIYSTMLRRDRNLLHGKVAESIERLFAGRLEAKTELLANHYYKSGSFEQALHYLILSGQKASRDNANEQARQHYEMALGLLARTRYSPSQALHIHSGLGDVLTLVGEFQAARFQFQAALDSTHTGPRDVQMLSRSDLQRKIAATFERQGDFDKALDRLSSARSLLQEIGQPDWVAYAQILNDMAWIRARRGKHDEAEADLVQALALVENSSRIDLIASIYNRLGGLHFMMEDFAQASVYTGKSLGLREDIGDIEGAARSYNNLGILAYNMGQWTQALEHYQKHVQLQNRIGDAEALAISYMNMALVQVGLGEFDTAESNLVKSREIATQIGATFHQAMAELYTGRLAVNLQEYQRAIDHIEISQRLFMDLGSEENLVDVYHLLGSAYLGQDDLPSAKHWAELAIQLLSRLGTHLLEQSDQHGRIYRLLGKIARREGELDTAHINLQSSLKIFELRGSQYEGGRTLVELAHLAGERGDKSHYGLLLEQARARFEPLGALHDLALIEEAAKKVNAGLGDLSPLN